MALVAFGLNHKTAPVELREQVTVVPESIEQQLQALLTLPAVNEATWVSTCNRTEVYCDIEGDQQIVIDWFLEQFKLEPENHLQHIYKHLNEHTIRHLLRVASGLDSMVVGEPQILGQLKSAYQTAETAGTTGSNLHKLFQFAFSVAKQVRTETDIGASPVSVAYTGVKLANQLFSQFADKKALLIGAGETIELCGQHLISKHLKHITIANRSASKSEALAQRFEQQGIKATSIPLHALHEHLPSHDIVISSTASQLPLVGKGMVETALKARKRKPMFLLDLAVPRDIEAEVNKLDDAYLYNLDDLQEFINQGLQNRNKASEEAELIIEQKVNEFLQWQQGQTAIDSIRQYREWAQAQQTQLMAKANSMQSQGKSTEEIVKAITEQQKNKLLHMPTLLMRHLAENNQLQSLLFAESLLDTHSEDNAADSTEQNKNK